MLLNHVWLVVFWIFYGVLHSVFAHLSVKEYFQKNLPAVYRHYRLLYNVQAFAGLGLIVWYQWQLTSVTLYEPTMSSKIAGAILSTAGLVLMLFCIKKYFLGLSGLRSLWEDVPAESLHVAGIHRFVRHPLYLGTFAFLWGLVILFPTASLLLTALVITAYTLLAIRWEEQKLISKFGAAYISYQHRVPKLLPRFTQSS